LDAIRAWLNGLVPRAVTELGYERAPTGEAIFAIREEGAEELVSARSLSDGTLRFAALTFAALGARTRTTLVIEEVENGINPARLSLLIQMMEQVTRSSTDVQVIASTHSPGILDFASRETGLAAVVVGWDAESMSSLPVRVGNIKALQELGDTATLGELQAEGWLQMAANG
jgi:predicted ATPase